MHVGFYRINAIGKFFCRQGIDQRRSPKLTETMELEAEISKTRALIASCGPRGVVVAEKTFTQSFLIAPDGTPADWEVRGFSALSPARLEQLCLVESDVLMIGTGVTQCFPDAGLTQILAKHGRSVEFMNSRTACSTFNVLALDDRQVMAAIILPL
ncbi:MAG TPA: hypothetical protein DIC24_03230 [Gammaproteobacteria bacterium]|nr:hypothetical protein [Gammaproteobacteria bacterium]